MQLVWEEQVKCHEHAMYVCACVTSHHTYNTMFLITIFCNMIIQCSVVYPGVVYVCLCSLNQHESLCKMALLLWGAMLMMMVMVSAHGIVTTVRWYTVRPRTCRKNQ